MNYDKDVEVKLVITRVSREDKAPYLGVELLVGNNLVSSMAYEDANEMFRGIKQCVEEFIK